MSNVTGVYIRQPIRVEAARLEIGKFKEITEWCGADQSVYHAGHQVSFYIRSARQSLIGKVGDWLVKEPDGTYRIYSSEEFRQTHLHERFHHDDESDWPVYDH